VEHLPPVGPVISLQSDQESVNHFLHSVATSFGEEVAALCKQRIDAGGENFQPEQVLREACDEQGEWIMKHRASTSQIPFNISGFALK